MFAIVSAATWGIACERWRDEERVVELWALGREGEVVERLVPEFERRNPGLRVRVQQVPWSAAHAKLLTAYVGEAMPDVFQVGNTWIPELVALGALEPLDERLASSSVRLEDYFAGIVETNELDGRLYGVPWYVDTRLLFYRKDLLEAAGIAAAPVTWPEWVAALHAVKERAGPRQFAILLPLDEWQTPVILALQLDAELLRDGDRFGNFQGAGFRDAFEFYVGLFRRGFAPRAGEAQMANVHQEFARGTFAFYVTGPWNLGEFRRRLPSSLAAAWATTAMPGPTRGPGASIAGGASLVLFRGSERKDGAWKLIEYLSEPEQQLELYRLTGDLPARRSAWEDPLLAEDEHAAAFRVQLQHVKPTPRIPEWERIAATVARTAEAVIRGRQGLDEALRALDHDVDGILEKRRWMLERGPADDAAGLGEESR